MASSEESLVAACVAYIGMIQTAITRMSGVSASSKTFLVTVLAVLAATQLPFTNHLTERPLWRSVEVESNV